MTVVAVLGLVIGLLLGLLGGGGSILAVPALVYGAGLPLAAAVTTSLLVVGLSSVTAVLSRLRKVQWRLAAVIGGAGALAAFAGAAVNRLLNPRLVLLGFAALMIAAGVRMLTDSRDGKGGACVLPSGGVDWRRCLPRSLPVGLAVGFLTGLFGVGGGFLIIPALVLTLGLPMTTAVPTSLAIVVINSVFGFIAHVGDAAVDFRLAAVFAGTAIAGSLLAARLADRVPADLLRRWFAYLVFATAVFVIVQAVINPAAG
ncbi:MAG: sulfite exporter TauE/SafE family protein [Nakamurella sp.]